MSRIPWSGPTADADLPRAVHPAALGDEQLLAQCQVTRGRKSGPGGQHRNKVESAVQIVHQPSGVHGAASECRSQAENRRVALFRLRVNLALQQRGYYQPRHGPSDLWRSRRQPGGLFRVNPQHHDFPAVLAEALDMLEALRWDVTRAANVLGCSSSQLVRLLSLEPRALQAVNQQRQKRGEHLLR